MPGRTRESPFLPGNQTVRLRRVSILTEVDLHTLSVDRFAPLVGEAKISALKDAAANFLDRFDGHAIWHVNSTATGGGVAEMLPAHLGYFRSLGLQARWLVISGDLEFFRITKRLHHALHGEPGDGSPLDANAQQVYEENMRANAVELLALVRPGDFVILHDPQTIGLAPALREHGARIIWRCHIGHSKDSDDTAAAWRFLAPYLRDADHYVFSCPDYVPDELDHGRSTVIYPGIDPFSPKNQELSDDAVRTILVHSGLLERPMPANPDFSFQRGDGTMDRVDRHADIIRCGRPIRPNAPLVTQVSRWDPLKDPVGVMRGFSEWLSRGGDNDTELVLAGPTVHSVADDPESPGVFANVFNDWCGLPHVHRSRIHLVMLPMSDAEENAAIVNALQRHSSVIVQKSLQEGFGLTVTEAMWKSTPVLASRVGGISEQLEDGVQGILLDDPRDTREFASALQRILEDERTARRMGAAGHERVTEKFLELNSVVDFIELIISLDTN